MGIKFPFEGMPAEHAAIETSPHSPEEINAADIGAWQYPLIIRLETLADKNAAATHVLSERAAGERLAPWVQSQTTYVVLGEAHDADAEDDSKVVRQRIYVQGQFYLLQARRPRPRALHAARTDPPVPLVVFAAAPGHVPSKVLTSTRASAL
jgi:hypothetical protein